MMSRTVAVASSEPSRLTRLLSVLAEWLEINIITHDLCDGGSAHAEVVFCRTAGEVESALARTARERLVLFRGKSGSQHGSAISFSRSPQLPPMLRGQQLEQQVEALLPELCTGEILADFDGIPVWTTVRDNDRRTDFAAEALPELQPWELLFDHLHSMQWTGLIPLIAFLRRVAADQHWVSPPLRACIMFDDPNLHWPTYGFIDYAALAQHAKTHAYHVAISTIPLDAWFTHSGAAKLFSANAAHLSLLVHGNNHTRNELARSYANTTRQGLVAQSLKRIARMERISKLRIPKIMAAPHSACTDGMAGELLRQGYEAVCISHNLLRCFNPTPAWPPSFGLQPAEFLSNGLPVLPRFPLSNKCIRPAILTAFLGQPMIAFGHHQDAADRLNLVAKISEGINRIDGVEWCNLTYIARTNYKHRISGNTLQLQMYSRHIQLTVPRDLETLQVDRPWLGPTDLAEPLEMRVNNKQWVQVKNGEIPRQSSSHEALNLEIRSIWPQSVDYRQIRSQSPQVWAIVRRLLTEARDRCGGCGA